MEPINAVLNNIFLIIVLIASFWFIRRQLTKGDFAHRTIKYMFLLAGILLVADALMRLNHVAGVYNEVFCKILITIGTFLLPVLGLLWFLYTCFAAKINVRLSIVYGVAITLLAINGTLAVLSVLPGFDIYYQMAEHSLIFGRYYFINTIILLIPFVASLVVVFTQWNSMYRHRNPFTFFYFSLIPIIAVVAQHFFAGYSLSLMGVVASFIIIVLDVQHQFAITDFLTGLANRRNLIKYVGLKIKKLRNGERFAGFMLDINNFKKINDKYGHTLGDQVLLDVANLLISVTSKKDYVARFGGDEFVLIIDLKDDGEIEAYKKLMRDACERYNSEQKNIHAIELSIGSALFSKDEGMTPTRFLEIIDDRMYIDKQSTKAV